MLCEHRQGVKFISAVYLCYVVGALMLTENTRASFWLMHADQLFGVSGMRAGFYDVTVNPSARFHSDPDDID